MRSQAQAAMRAWWLAGAVAALTSVSLMVWFWAGGLPYDSTSGVWSALADDLRHGEFYRDVDGATGFGGTRYTPVFFSLHAALIHVGLPMAAAGLLLTVASLALLYGMTFALMRRWGVGATLAIPGAALMSASISWQLLSISIKGDLLAAALNAGALVLGVTAVQKDSRGWLRLAGVVAGIAVLTKFTEIFALGSLVLWFASRSEWRKLLRLTISAIIVIGLGAVAAWRLSDGRIADAFAVCATGGLRLAYAWRFPFWFVRVAGEDPFFLVLLSAGALVAWRRWRRLGADLPVFYFSATAVGTVLIFTSPGTDSNHLLDLLAASVVLLTIEFTEGALDARLATWGALLLSAAIATTWIPGTISVRHFLEARGRPTAAAVQEIARRLPSGAAARMLSENPIVPLALGERPRVLDCFSLRLLAQRSPAVREKFRQQLQSRFYSAVVLVDWSGVPLEQRWIEMERHTSPGADHFYGDVHFPPDFLETLRAHYRLSFVVSPFVVFEPIMPTSTPP